MKQVNYLNQRGPSPTFWGRIASMFGGSNQRRQYKSAPFHRFGTAHARPAVKDSFYNSPIGSRPNALIGALLVLAGTAISGNAVMAQMQSFSPQWPGVGPISGKANPTPMECIEHCLYNPDPHLVLDGGLNDWLPLGRYYPSDAYDAQGGGNQTDFLDAWVAHNHEYIYLAYTSNTGIVLNHTQNIYFDTDWNQHSGYRIGAIGADYLLQGENVYRYNGDGSTFSWLHIGKAEAVAYGCQVELRFPRQWLGHTNKFRFVMQADNPSSGGTVVDYFPDRGAYGANYGGEYFCYRLVSERVLLNNPPVAHSGSWETYENTPVEITVAASDPDGDPVYFGKLSGPHHGSIHFVSPVVFIYTPEPGFHGIDEITFFVTDTIDGSTTETITITVHKNQTNPGGGHQYPWVSNPIHGTIKINGWLDEWNSLTDFGADPDDADDHVNRVDWRKAWMAHSNHSLYLAYMNGSHLNAYEFNWGFTCYIDSDSESTTGFRGASAEYGIGADYLIQGNQVYKYAGHGTDWIWSFVGFAVSGVYENKVELALPLNWIGNPHRAHIVFVGMNQAYTGGYNTDHYPDDAVTYNTCFRYEFSPVPAPTSVEQEKETVVISATSARAPTESSALSAWLMASAPEAQNEAQEDEVTSSIEKLQINWTAPTGSLVTIQYSTDLVNWTDLQTLETQDGLTGFVVEEINQYPSTFFRAVPAGNNSESVSRE